MKAREKFIVTVSILACCIAIAAFAMVSLGHFISTPSKTRLPVVGRMYENTIQQVALLDTVTIPSAAPTTDTKSSDPTAKKQPTPVMAKNNVTGSKQNTHKSTDRKSTDKHDSDDEDVSYDELKAFLC